jgi:septal ring factor EnvC (AmiA/AmiB activator)
MFKKMFKWTLISAVILGAGGLFVFGDHAGSYFHTVSSAVRDSVKDNIPVEFEIKRAEKLIRAIDPQIYNCKKEVARAEVDLSNLIDEVGRIDETVTKQEKRLRQGRTLLQEGDAELTTYTLRGQSYPRARVELDLQRLLASCKNNKSILMTKRKLIERQTRAVEASSHKLHTVRNRKAELENTIAALKVQKHHLDAMVATSKRFDLDDSALSRATKVLADVKKRLDVTQKMIESDLYFADGITEENTKRRTNILKEINAHFGAHSSDLAPAKKQLSPRHEVPAVGTGR